MLGLKIFVVEYLNDTRVCNIIGRSSKAKHNKSLAISRQKQQCSLSHVRCLRGNNIFFYIYN
jgi:hypothetical protein